MSWLLSPLNRVAVVAMLAVCGGIARAQETVNRSDQGRLHAGGAGALPEKSRVPEVTVEKGTPPRIRAFAGTAAFFTNNAGLDRDDPHLDAYFETQTGLGAKWKFAGGWAVDARLKQKIFRYSGRHELDYESLNPGLELSWRTEQLRDVKWFAKYNFERLSDHFGEEFFRSHTGELGAEKTFDWRGGYFYAGYSSTFGWASPTRSQRNEHGLYLGAWCDFTRSLGGELYYRTASYDYAGTRRDFYQTAMASLVWEMSEHASLSASFSWTRDRSNRADHGYQELNAGGGLSLQVRF